MKNTNLNKILPLLEECNWKEYSVMKRIVEDIRKNQDRKYAKNINDKSKEEEETSKK